MDKSILVAEDNAELLNLICEYLNANGWTTHSATTLDQATQLLEKNKIDVVLTDFHLAEGSGRQLCRWVKNKKEMKIPVFMMTGTPYVTENDFNIYQFDKVFIKPVKLKELKEALNSIQEL